MKKAIWILAACTLCIDWTRLKGTVKIINLKESTITLMNREGDLLTIPVDYQVKIVDKSDELLDIRRMTLDQKITLMRTPQDRPAEDTTGMASPERGH